MTDIDESTVTSAPIRLLGLGTVPRADIAPYSPTTALPAPTTRWAQRYRLRLAVTDLAVVAIAIAVAYVVRFGIDDSLTLSNEWAATNASVSLLVGIAWLIALAAYRTRDRRIVGFGTTEYRRVVGASAIAFGLLGIGFLVSEVDIARGYFVLAMPIGLAGLLVDRWLWRKWLMAARRQDRFVSRAVVVGDADAVRYVVKQINASSGSSYRVVGAAVDGVATGAVPVQNEPVPIISGLDDVAAAARAQGADVVIVAGQPRDASDDYIRTLSWDLEGTATELVLASRLVDVAGPRIHFRPVEGLPLIHVEIPQFEGGKHILKRAFDVVVSGTALLALLPFFLVIGLLVKLEDGGPVLFSQERIGRKGSRFRMLKFRSMVVDAEAVLETLSARSEGNGILFKMKNDPRVTRVGAVIRKYSLDEFPQLWNVFCGDMSLVGPRPPLEREVAQYEQHVHRRLYIKPGLTGMWQIGGRSNLSWDESVRLDLYYVENWSITGDVIIIWRTFRELVHPTGAY